jgi:hypothetical protein
MIQIHYFREDCGAFFTDAEIDRAVGLFWTNAFSMSSGVGQAVFPTFSFVSHSCVSNSNHVVFPNRHLALQAKVFIPKGDELTISYISPIQVSDLLPVNPNVPLVKLSPSSEHPSTPYKAPRQVVFRVPLSALQRPHGEGQQRLLSNLSGGGVACANGGKEVCEMRRDHDAQRPVCEHGRQVLGMFGLRE